MAPDISNHALEREEEEEEEGEIGNYHQSVETQSRMKKLRGRSGRQSHVFPAGFLDKKSWYNLGWAFFKKKTEAISRPFSLRLWLCVFRSQEEEFFYPFLPLCLSVCVSFHCHLPPLLSRGHQSFLFSPLLPAAELLLFPFFKEKTFDFFLRNAVWAAKKEISQADIGQSFDLPLVKKCRSVFNAS